MVRDMATIVIQITNIKQNFNALKKHKDEK